MRWQGRHPSVLYLLNHPPRIVPLWERAADLCQDDFLPDARTAWAVADRAAFRAGCQEAADHLALRNYEEA